MRLSFFDYQRENVQKPSVDRAIVASPATPLPKAVRSQVDLLGAGNPPGTMSH